MHCRFGGRHVKPRGLPVVLIQSATTVLVIEAEAVLRGRVALVRSQSIEPRRLQLVFCDAATGLIEDA